MKSYDEFVKKLKEAINKYKDLNLSLREFIYNVFVYCDYDVTLIDNVYIDEVKNYPNVWGCYKEGDKFITYYTNDRQVINFDTYEDPYDFIYTFILSSRNNCKYEQAFHSKNL